jgi:hypothetical protein
VREVIGSRFSPGDVGHREIVSPRRNPRMDSGPVPQAPRTAPDTFRLHSSTHVNLQN